MDTQNMDNIQEHKTINDGRLTKDNEKNGQQTNELEQYTQDNGQETIDA